MRVRMWPERKKGAVIRVFVLLGILVLVIIFTVQVRSFRGGEAFLTFASRILGARLFSGALKPESCRGPSQDERRVAQTLNLMSAISEAEWVKISRCHGRLDTTARTIFTF